MSVDVGTIEVEIWSDIACPWCYIGKRRFERSLEQFEHADSVRLRWRSFELDPEAPREREGDRAERIARKYGIGVDRFLEMEQEMVAQAASEGLDFQLEIQRQGRTFDGHRVIQLASEHGLGNEMKERLMRAYFSEGTLVADHGALLALGLEVGLPRDELHELLAGDRFADEVRADERTALELGITAVPTFVIDRSRGISGAQPPELLLKLLRVGWDNRE